MGSCPHTHFATGARLLIVLRDGTRIVDRFVERNSRFLVTRRHRIATSDLKSVVYAKHGRAVR